jgi:two-component system, response regulator YesN
MIQLLIVDDEQIERDGMKAILHKSFPSLDIQEARNGRMAIEMAEQLKPELILMDIKMPGMDGLEALEQIIAISPTTKFVMVTAYDTFDYMRQAIKLGATDYLLKPSKANDIVETVGKVLKEIVMEQKSRVTNERQQIVFQRTMAVIETDVVTQLLFEHVHEVHFDMLVEILDINTNNEVFVMNIRMPAGAEHLYSTVKEKVRRIGFSLVGALYENQLPVVVFRNGEASFRSQAVKLAREVLSVKKLYDQAGWYIGIGNVYPTLAEVKKSYHEALIATMEKASLALYQFHSEVKFVEEASDEQKLKELKKEIRDHIRLGHWDKVRTEVMSVIQMLENKGTNVMQAQQRVLEVLWVVSSILGAIGMETNTPLYSFQTPDYRQLRAETGQLLDQMKELYINYYKRLEADNMEQIKQYIMAHSHEEISLDTLGTKMGLSPIYISKMFKEKLGINYIDFLTECRIEKAKNLMNDPNRSIKEIAIEVGYHEPNYFSKVFKKIVHVSPREYQNTIHGKRISDG